jgi:hypothetical protein
MEINNERLSGAYKALLEFRNAKRDALYAEHGDDWRKHEKHPGKYWHFGPLDEEEAEAVDKYI